MINLLLNKKVTKLSATNSAPCNLFHPLFSSNSFTYLNIIFRSRISVQLRIICFIYRNSLSPGKNESCIILSLQNNQIESISSKNKNAKYLSCLILLLPICFTKIQIHLYNLGLTGCVCTVYVCLELLIILFFQSCFSDQLVHQSQTKINMRIFLDANIN